MENEMKNQNTKCCAVVTTMVIALLMGLMSACGPDDFRVAKKDPPPDTTIVVVIGADGTCTANCPTDGRGLLGHLCLSNGACYGNLQCQSGICMLPSSSTTDPLAGYLGHVCYNGTCYQGQGVCQNGYCQPYTATAYCGNGKCESGETCSSCAADCGACGTPAPTTGGLNQPCGGPAGCTCNPGLYCDSAAGPSGTCASGGVCRTEVPHWKCTGLFWMAATGTTSCQYWESGSGIKLGAAFAPAIGSVIYAPDYACSVTCDVAPSLCGGPWDGTQWKSWNHPGGPLPAGGIGCAHDGKVK